MSDILTQKQEKEIQTLLGKIKVKVPTLPQRLDIEKKRSFYAGGLAIISETGAELAEIFATLDVVMIDCEKLNKNQNGTWNYDELSEFDIEKVEDVYKKATEWLDSFRKGLAGK